VRLKIVADKWDHHDEEEVSLQAGEGLTSASDPIVLFGKAGDPYVRDAHGQFAPKSGGGGASAPGKKKLSPGAVDTKRLNASEAAELKDIEGQLANGAITEKEAKYKTYYVKVKASKRINKSGGAASGPEKAKVAEPKKSGDLKTGDSVITPAGSKGKITGMPNDDTVEVELEDGGGSFIMYKDKLKPAPGFKKGDKLTHPSGSEFEVISEHGDFVKVKTSDGEEILYNKKVFDKKDVGPTTPKKINTPSSSSGPSSVGAAPKKKLTAGKVKSEHYSADELKQQEALDKQFNEGSLTDKQYKSKTSYLKYKVATRHNASAPGSSGGVKTGGVSSAVPGLHSNVPGVASSIPASIRQPNSLTRKTALANADILRKSSRSQIESDYSAKPNDAVVRAHKSYTGSGYTPMNRAARGLETPAASTARSITKMDQSFSIYGKKNNEPIFVNRGVKGRYAADLGKLKPGETITERGFMSTSTSKMTGNSFGSSGRRIEIAVPSGKTSIAGTDYEKELIFPRNTQLKFIGKNDDGILQFDMI